MTKPKQEPKQPAEQPARRALELPRCEYCGTPFIPTGPKQKYHTDACRVAAFRERQRDNDKE
jgi:hypothetical protein